MRMNQGDKQRGTGTVSWQAPRIAYELAAEWARDAGRRGAGDPPREVPKMWHDLRPATRADVLIALSGQARAGRVLLAPRGLLPRLDMTALLESAGAAGLCLEAWQALLTWLADEPVQPAAPACGHCAAVTAAALLAVAYRCYELAGFTAEVIAAHCAAAAGAEPPALRIRDAS